MDEIFNKDLFYSNMIYERLTSFIYERPLNAFHLKPVEDFLFNGKELTPFSEELFTYQEARKCALDFEIYTLQENYEKYPNVVDLLMDCYRYAVQEGVMEAFNNIGVFYGMTGRIEEAIPYFECAAKAGCTSGMTNLMSYYDMKEDYDMQFYYIDRLIRKKNVAGMYNYAIAYHFGYRGRKRDIKKAKKMYQKMMGLGLEDDYKPLDYDSDLILRLKTWACYNLAKIRFLTEEHSKDNLESIIYLLSETPYVLLDQPRSNQLIEEIKQSIY